jgi:hypothetical protein
VFLLSLPMIGRALGTFMQQISGQIVAG